MDDDPTTNFPTEGYLVGRDKLVRKINSRRYAIQNAADRLYPYWNDDFDPARRLFKLPGNRPSNG